jgi:hypothetical protein
MNQNIVFLHLLLINIDVRLKYVDYSFHLELRFHSVVPLADLDLSGALSALGLVQINDPCLKAGFK